MDPENPGEIIWNTDFPYTMTIPAFTDSVDAAENSYATGICGEKKIALVDASDPFPATLNDGADPVLDSFTIVIE